MISSRSSWWTRTLSTSQVSDAARRGSVGSNPDVALFLFAEVSLLEDGLNSPELH